MINLNNSKGLKLLFILIFGGTMVGTILILGYISKTQEEYPKLDFVDDLSGSISRISKYQSVVLIELDNGRKSMIIDSRNYAYNPYLIQDLIMAGDFLDKKENSDILIINRKKQKFIFVIGDELNLELKPNL